MNLQTHDQNSFPPLTISSIDAIPCISELVGNVKSHMNCMFAHLQYAISLQLYLCMLSYFRDKPMGTITSAYVVVEILPWLLIEFRFKKFSTRKSVKCNIFELKTGVVSPSEERKEKGSQVLVLKGNIECIRIRCSSIKHQQENMYISNIVNLKLVARQLQCSCWFNNSFNFIVGEIQVHSFIESQQRHTLLACYSKLSRISTSRDLSYDSAHQTEHGQK